MSLSILEEYLGQSDSNISESAIEGDSKWLICPKCNEAWESDSLKAMVICPKCNRALHNPCMANIPNVIQKSLCLEKYGLNDFAWTKDDALTLIRAIMRDHIGILEGDVYKLNPDRLEPLYDNWSCEPMNTETEEEYYSRSKIESLNYIENYAIGTGENIIFSITFTEKLL